MASKVVKISVVFCVFFVIVDCKGGHGHGGHGHGGHGHGGHGHGRSSYVGHGGHGHTSGGGHWHSSGGGHVHTSGGGHQYSSFSQPHLDYTPSSSSSHSYTPTSNGWSSSSKIPLSSIPDFKQIIAQVRSELYGSSESTHTENDITISPTTDGWTQTLEELNKFIESSEGKTQTNIVNRDLETFTQSNEQDKLDTDYAKLSQQNSDEKITDNPQNNFDFTKSMKDSLASSIDMVKQLGVLGSEDVVKSLLDGYDYKYWPDEYKTTSTTESYIDISPTQAKQSSTLKTMESLNTVTESIVDDHNSQKPNRMFFDLDKELKNNNGNIMKTIHEFAQNELGITTTSATTTTTERPEEVYTTHANNYIYSSDEYDTWNNQYPKVPSTESYSTLPPGWYPTTTTTIERYQDPEMPSKETLKAILAKPPWWVSLFIAV